MAGDSVVVTEASYDALQGVVVRRRVVLTLRLLATFYAAMLAIAPQVLMPPGMGWPMAAHLGRMLGAALLALLVLWLARVRARLGVEAVFIGFATLLMALAGSSTTLPFNLKSTTGTSFAMLATLALATKISWRACAVLCTTCWLAAYTESRLFEVDIFIELAAAAAAAVMLCFHLRLRDRLERESFEDRRRLAEANRQLIAAEARALAAQREAFLAEVHDGVGASLTRAALALAAAGDPANDDRAASDALAAIRDGLSETRAMMTLLEAHPETWQAVVAGVRGELTDACARAELTARIDITSDADADVTPLSPAEALAIRRVVREALTNIIKHAQARTVSCVLALRGGVAHVRVADDGPGVPIDAQPGRGLGILARRIRDLGGTSEFGTAPSGGGFVDARFAVAAAAAAAKAVPAS